MQQHEQNSTTHTQQPKRRRWLRTLLISLGVILAIALLTVAGIIIWLGPLAEYVIEEYDKELTGRRIELSDLRIKLFEGRITADSMRLYEGNDSTLFVDLDHLESDIAIGEVLNRHIDIRRIALVAPRARITQHGEEFNFDDMLRHIDTTYLSTDTPDNDSAPWQVSIKSITIEDGVASYLDQELDQRWEVDSLRLHTDSLVLSGAPTHIDLGMLINSQARLDGALEFNLDNLDFDFAGKLDKFSLGDLYNYIVPTVNIQQLYGTLATTIELHGNLNNILGMDVSGEMSVDNLLLTAYNGAELLGADNIFVGINSLNIDKQQYLLSSLTASGYSTEFVMHADGSTNFDGLFYEEPEVSIETTSERVGEHIYDQRERVTITTDDNATPFSGMTLHIGHLSLRGGNLHFADKTMAKEFDYKLHGIAIESRDFDIVQRNKLTVRANLHNKGTALLRWEGSLNDFYNQSLLASLSNVDMKDFSPYTEHFTAFPITSGNLTFRSQNTITNGELSGINRLGTYDFAVGKKNKSLDPEYKLPLKLGVYILTDKDDHIDVDLPITGHIDSPEFSFRKLIFKAIGNLLVKIAASPFDWMTPDKQSTFRAINFSLLEPGLSSEQYARLDKMAEALTEDQTLKVRLTQSVSYSRAVREIADMNLKMAYYNSQQENPNERLDMLDFERINEMRLSSRDVSKFADSLLRMRGIDPSHLSTHAKAEALYSDVIDMQLSRIMELRNKIIGDYMSFQHKELPEGSFTMESMTLEQMKSYNGRERLAVTLIIDDEEVEVADEDTADSEPTQEHTDAEPQPINDAEGNISHGDTLEDSSTTYDAEINNSEQTTNKQQ